MVRGVLADSRKERAVVEVPTLDNVDPSRYDFLDFGASKGDSLMRYSEAFGGRGLGIDNDPKKVRQATQHGHDVVFGDITTLPRRKIVRYVVMSHFLEHLPDQATAREMLEIAACVAHEFIYINHPSFEDEAYLRSLGLKQFWQDWTGHPNHLLLSDLTEMLRDVGARPIDLTYIKPEWNSRSRSILPLDAPPDQQHYSLSQHGHKKDITFDKPIHWQMDIVGYTDNPCKRVEKLERKVGALRSRKAIRIADACGRLKRGSKGV